MTSPSDSSITSQSGDVNFEVEKCLFDVRTSHRSQFNSLQLNRNSNITESNELNNSETQNYNNERIYEEI